MAIRFADFAGGLPRFPLDLAGLTPKLFAVPSIPPGLIEAVSLAAGLGNFAPGVRSLALRIHSRLPSVAQRIHPDLPGFALGFDPVAAGFGEIVIVPAALREGGSEQKEGSDGKFHSGSSHLLDTAETGIGYESFLTGLERPAARIQSGLTLISFKSMRRLIFFAVFGVCILSAQTFDPKFYAGLEWRMIGPFRGGRTVGAAGIAGQPNVFYVGVNNGGVWKTDDFGRTWNPVFDDQPTGSIGTIALAPSDPNIIYAGSGEGLQRPDLSVGDGMYKSTDAGKTWRHLGLRDGQQIPAIIVDPRDPNRLFVAAMGHPYGPNQERGVYRSTDGGAEFRSGPLQGRPHRRLDLAFDP